MKGTLTLVINKENFPTYTHILENSKNKENAQNKIKVIFCEEGIDELLLDEIKNTLNEQEIQIFDNSFRLETMLDFVTWDNAGDHFLLFTHKKDMKSFNIYDVKYEWNRNDNVHVLQKNKWTLPKTLNSLYNKVIEENKENRMTRGRPTHEEMWSEIIWM